MLKSLELFGFKSFAERTRFDFSPGITAVVGPNGSGKSNVVDAIKWILGDQSPKSLRGSEMTDVIFNGAAGRKGSGFAEATLDFDNTSGFLPTELRQVQIGRRLWRGGDSEYLINKSVVRLKDVRDLLMGTGAGAAAYCIIEQGRVDQILQASAASRRQIFEEAAGVSRYKARKTEALRKLERVEQNLLRLTDIVDEVEARLASVRSQAAKAARYRELSDELKRWWLGLAADDFRHLSAQRGRVEQSLEQNAAQRNALAARQQDLEARLGALDEEIAEADGLLRRVERRSAANREVIASHEATIRHQAARGTELEADHGRLRRQRTVMALRARGIRGEIEEAGEALVRSEAAFNELTDQLELGRRRVAELQAQLAAERDGLDQCRQQLVDAMREASAAEARLTALKSQCEALATTRAGAAGRRASLDEQMAAASAACDQRRGCAESAAADLAAAAARLKNLQESRRTLLGEQEEYQRALAELREQRSAARARLTVLEDLERRQQGLGIGVREILERARTSHYPPWNGIRGSVADLLEVDLEQAALLEVALGARAQLIVLDDLAPLIEYLESGACRISGRVGFIARCAAQELAWNGAEEIEKRRDGKGASLKDGASDGCSAARPSVAACCGSAASELPEPAAATEPLYPSPHLPVVPSPRRLSANLASLPGVQARADRLVRTPEGLEWLAERLLADTWVVDTLGTALELAADAGEGCRFVTLQGELLDVDGTLAAGTLRNEAALVSRKSELRRLKNDLLRMDHRIAAEERRLAGLSNSLSDSDGALAAAEAEMQSAADRHAEEKAQLAACDRELARLCRDRDALEEELARLAREDERLQAALDQAGLDRARADEDLRALQADLAQAEHGLARSEQRLQSLEHKAAEEHLDLTRHEGRLHGLRASFERLRQEQEQRLQQQEEAERRERMVAAKCREITLHILNTRAVVAELLLAEESHALEAATYLGDKERLRGRRAELLREEAALREERRRDDDQRHRDEIQLRDVEHQLEALRGRIDEEYQLTLEEVVASGASAVTLSQEEPPPAGDGPSEERGEPEGAGEDDGEADGARNAEHGVEGAGGSPADSVSVSFASVRDALEARVNRLRRKLKLMGSVDTESLANLEELESRHGHLSTQLEDLVQAKAALEEIVRRINAESKRLFVETFETVRGHFQHLFRRAFGGGDGDIVLEDREDVLECGIEIVARPPGKELKSISLMSGGEKALTAFALLLAFFKTRPSPYCLLDEVDAPLDEANVGRLGALLEEFKGSTQFIVITHKKPTMAIADVLYGVTMEQAGVSKRMSVRFEDVSENGEFSTAAPQREAA